MFIEAAFGRLFHYQPRRTCGADNGVIPCADYTDALKGAISDERIGELCKSSLSKARKLVATQLLAVHRDTMIAASDIMNGVTLDKVRDGWFPWQRLLGFIGETSGDGGVRGNVRCAYLHAAGMGDGS